MTEKIRNMSFEIWREHLANLPDCNFTVTENPLMATFSHPGLDFNCFDRNQNIGITSLMGLVLDIRQFGTWQTSTMKANEMYNLQKSIDDRIPFVSSAEFIISRAMYDKTVPKWPVRAKVYLGYMGNSTLSFPLEVYMPRTSEPLLKSITQIVTVDPETRRPKPFPDWLRERYKKQCSMDRGFRVNTFTRPDITYSYKRKVMWLDTDQYEHTNFTYYVRYAIDGLHVAIKEQNAMEEIRSSLVQSQRTDVLVSSEDCSQINILNLPDGVQSNGQPVQMKKALKGISEAVIGEGVKNLKICYISQCVDGDTLDVHIWQDEGEEYIVRCSIEKDSATICQIILEYFSPVSKL